MVSGEWRVGVENWELTIEQDNISFYPSFWTLVNLMKKITFAASFLLLAPGTRSQQVVISNRHYNRLYVGIYNPLDILVEGNNCKSVLVSTDNGAIEKHSCTYILTPARTGTTNITVSIKRKNMVKVIKVVPVYTDSLPAPIATVAGKQGGEINQGFFAAQPGIQAMSVIPAIDIDYEIKKFTIIVYRNDSILFFHENNSALFDLKTKEILKNTQNRDTVLLANLVCTMPDGTQKRIKPLEFYIQ